VASRLSLPRAPRLSVELARAEGMMLRTDEHWEGVAITADFSGQGAEDAEIAGCRVTRSQFVNSTLLRARVSDTVFERCDLSAAVFTNALLVRVEFDDCRLSGADFSGLKMSDVRFRDCPIVDGTFRLSSGDRVRFEHCDLSNADLYGAQIRGGCFFDSDLTGADLSQASLAQARMHGSTLGNLRGVAALRGTTIDPSQVGVVAQQLLPVLDITVDDQREPSSG
jgi:uncharacterized protein YjbI with pentapeptide repeats